MRKKLLLLTVAAMAMFGSIAAVSALQYVFICTGGCAYYVDDSAAPGGDGSIDSPYTSIKFAFDQMVGDTTHRRIRVAGGTYVDGLMDLHNFPRNAEIVGGYNSDFSVLDPEAYPVYIHMGGKTFLDVEESSVNISGFTFEDGSTGDAIISILLNTDDHEVNVVDNVFRNNSDRSGMVTGGSISSNSVINVRDNQFVNNDTNTGSGYIVGLFGSGDIERNLLRNNSAGILIGCFEGTVKNNFILDNLGKNAAALGAECRFVHNTVAHNELIATNSSVIRMSNSSNTVVNNLITGNLADMVNEHVSGDTSTFDYNALNGNAADPVTASANNVLCDPMYIGASETAVNDHHMSDASDCIDKGTNLAYVALDYDGVTRPADGDGDATAMSDPGAFEEPDSSIMAPVLSAVNVTNNPFSPNADGTADNTTLNYTTSEDANVMVEVYDASGSTLFKTLYPTQWRNAGPYTQLWDGTDTGGTTVADGDYLFKVTASNAGGGDTASVEVRVSTQEPEEEEPEEEEPEEEEPEEEDPEEEPTGQCGGYSDVAASHPDCDAIEFVQSIGAMTGNDNGTFEPNDVLQRDEVAKISLETFGLYDENMDYCADSSNVLSDMVPAMWSYQYVCRGVELEMITGYASGPDAGKYLPAQTVNRVEFLALVLRNVTEAMPALSSASYADVPTGQWFSGFARYSLDNDLFVGVNLLPEQGTTRAEVADAIFKLHNAGKLGS